MTLTTVAHQCGLAPGTLRYLVIEPERKPTLELIQDFRFEFYGELYIAHLANDRQFYIKLADVCVGMGLAIEAQRRRIREDEGMSDKLVMITADTIYKEVKVQRNLYL